MDIINKNALYREFLVKSGKTDRSYADIVRALSDKKEPSEFLSDKEKKLLKEIIDQSMTRVIRNIINS